MTNLTSLLLLLISSSIVLFSCQGYQESSVDNGYILSLTDSLSHGQRDGEQWAILPENIARHFFPPISHDGGPKLYQIKKQTISSTQCRVTVTEEGPIDDEMRGQRHTIYFQSLNGSLKIVDINVAFKRRY